MFLCSSDHWYWAVWSVWAHQRDSFLTPVTVLKEPSGPFRYAPGTTAGELSDWTSRCAGWDTFACSNKVMTYSVYSLIMAPLLSLQSLSFIFCWRPPCVAQEWTTPLVRTSQHCPVPASSAWWWPGETLAKSSRRCLPSSPTMAVMHARPSRWVSVLWLHVLNFWGRYSFHWCHWKVSR